MTSTAAGAELGDLPAGVPTGHGSEADARPVIWPWFAVLAVAVFLAATAWNWPTRMGFRGHFFGDPGANLAVQDLIRRGLRPTIDFVYQYGLLALLFGRAWFALLGASPLSFQVSAIVFGLWMIASLTRIVRDRKIGPSGAALLLVGLPFFVPSSQPNFAHGLESALLCQALAEQSRGRRATALALATAAVFAKPSLGFVYGLILLLATLGSLRDRRSVRALLGREGLGPAIATGLILLAVLAAVYGVVPLVRTVIPTAGMANYRAANFGFFRGVGRLFWNPPGVTAGYYVGTVVGFWIVGSLTLMAAGLAAARRLFADRGGAPLATGSGSAAEMVATCALLHATFVLGPLRPSVHMGLRYLRPRRRAGGHDRPRPRLAGWVWGLVVLASVGHKSTVTGPIAAWKVTSPAPETAGLWETAEARAEWSEVLGMTRGGALDGPRGRGLLRVARPRRRAAGDLLHHARDGRRPGPPPQGRPGRLGRSGRRPPRRLQAGADRLARIRAGPPRIRRDPRRPPLSRLSPPRTGPRRSPLNPPHIPPGPRIPSSTQTNR